MRHKTEIIEKEIICVKGVVLMLGLRKSIIILYNFNIRIIIFHLHILLRLDQSIFNQPVAKKLLETYFVVENVGKVKDRIIENCTKIFIVILSKRRTSQV